MYVLPPGTKSDPVKRWNLSERVFFACGACHILAFAFLERYPNAGFAPMCIRPAKGFIGGHIVVVRDNLAFDYHGYSSWRALRNHILRRANHRWPGWDAEIFPLPPAVLVSEIRSRYYDRLWLREPKQFLHDALPRARRYLDRFPPPGPLRPHSPVCVRSIRLHDRLRPIHSRRHPA
jgi:hypothetical protein